MSKFENMHKKYDNNWHLWTQSPL